MTEFDFQYAESDFLATKPGDLEEDMEKNRPSAWNSGRPYDWGAKKKKKKPEKESLDQAEGDSETDKTDKKDEVVGTE